MISPGTLSTLATGFTRRSTTIKTIWSFHIQCKHIKLPFCLVCCGHILILVVRSLHITISTSSAFKFFNCSESDSRAARSYSSFGCSHKTLSVQLLLLSHLNYSIVQNLTLGQHDNYDCACVPHDMKVVSKASSKLCKKKNIELSIWITKLVTENLRKYICQFMNRSSMATTIATTTWTASAIMIMR